MIDTKKILDSIKDKILFEPIDDRVLIKPLKQKYVKKSFTVPVSKPDAAEVKTTEVETTETLRETTEEVRDVLANCQLGVVLKMSKIYEPTIKRPFSEGDIIVYPTNAGIPFELFKDSRLLKRYEILGLWFNDSVFTSK